MGEIGENKGNLEMSQLASNIPQNEERVYFQNMLIVV